MRKFWLKDGGTEHSLQSDTLFFYAPTGFGFCVERDYDSVEDGFWASENSKAGQAEITGTLVFRKNPYESYREFADFIAQAKHLQLAYCPYGTQKYYMDVCMDSMEKGEMKAGVLEVPVQMHGTSPWQSGSRMRIVSTGGGERKIKRYGYGYPCMYSITGVSGRAQFRIAGHFDGGIEMRASGPLSAPIFTVKDAENGTVYGTVDLSSASIGEEETLRYSSLVNSAGIWKTDGDGGETDLIDSAELMSGIPLFMRIPKDMEVIAELASENAADTEFELTLYEYWRTR